MNSSADRRKLILGAIVFCSLALRLWAIGADLPDNFNPDEPHHLNVAARFGSGDLNPVDFKYPAFWHYVLAGLLGALFAAGTLLGLVANTRQFAELFLYEPTAFYLSARLLSALLASTAPLFLYAAGKRIVDERTGLFAAFLVAFSPRMLTYGRDATPYGLLILLIAAAWMLYAGLERKGSVRSYFLTGAVIGLACATQYVAAPLAVIIPLAALFSDRRRAPALIAAGAAGAAAGFFVGSPYSLIDFSRAWHDILDQARLQTVVLEKVVPPIGVRIEMALKTLARFMDAWGAGALLAVIGLIAAGDQRRKMAVLFIPWLILFPIIIRTDGTDTARYGLPVYIPLFVPAAVGVRWLWDRCGRVPAARSVLIALLLVPWMLSVGQARRYETLPDTRHSAEAWVRENVPMNGKIFLIGPHNGPRLMRSREQCRSLFEKTRELNHPRMDYYRLLLSGHPGGGYQIYFLERTAVEVFDMPSRVAKSLQAQETVNLSAGSAEPLLKEGIDTLVLDRAARSPDDRWKDDLGRAYSLAATFEPQPGRSKGPPIDIYTRN